jgi:hypothetical protein
MSIRPDVFQDRKCLHIKLKKETHADFKIALFKLGLSMQEVFEEFARQAGDGKGPAIKILNSASKKKLKAILSGKPRSRKKEKFGQLDVESLYAVISSINENEEDNEDD